MIDMSTDGSRKKKYTFGPTIGVLIGILAICYGLFSLIIRGTTIQSSILVFFGISAVSMNGYPVVNHTPKLKGKIVELTKALGIESASS